jgi:hypothetical protein
MTITNVSDPSTMTGAPVRSTDGEKLGKIDAICRGGAVRMSVGR